MEAALNICVANRQRRFQATPSSRLFPSPCLSTLQAPAWSGDEEGFRRWREGRTGWPLVDANMRELQATGEAGPAGGWSAGLLRRHLFVQNLAMLRTYRPHPHVPSPSPAFHLQASCPTGAGRTWLPSWPWTCRWGRRLVLSCCDIAGRLVSC